MRRTSALSAEILKQNRINPPIKTEIKGVDY